MTINSSTVYYIEHLTDTATEALLHSVTCFKCHPTGIVQFRIVVEFTEGGGTDSRRKRQASDIVETVSATCIEDQSVYNYTLIHSYMYV